MELFKREALENIVSERNMLAKLRSPSYVNCLSHPLVGVLAQYASRLHAVVVADHHLTIVTFEPAL